MSKLISNYLFTVIYQVLLMITPLITTPYIARILKAEGVGIDAYVASIVQLFIVFIVLSLPKYGSRQIAVRQNQQDTSKEFWSIFTFQSIVAVLNFAAYFIFLMTITEHKELFYLHLLTLLAYSFDISWYFIGKEQIKKITLRNVFVKITGIILIFTFVKEIDDLPIYIIINAATLLVGQLIMWVPILKEIKFVRVTLKEIKTHISPILVLFLPELMIQVYVLVNRIILGNISGEVEVGYYNQANKIIKIVLGVISSLGIVLLPRMASEFSKGNHEAMQKYIKYTLQFVLLISIPMMFGMMGIAPNLVVWFLGNEFLDVSTLLVIMSPVILFVGLANVFGIQVLISTNQQNKYSIAITIGAVLSLVTNFFLVYSLASVATTIALLVAEATGALIQMYFARKYFNFKEFLVLLFKYTVLGLLVFASVRGIGYALDITPILLTVVQLIVGVFIYLLGLIIIKDSMVFNVIRIIKGRVSKSQG